MLSFASAHLFMYLPACLYVSLAQSPPRLLLLLLPLLLLRHTKFTLSQTQTRPSSSRLYCWPWFEKALGQTDSTRHHRQPRSATLILWKCYPRLRTTIKTPSSSKQSSRFQQRERFRRKTEVRDSICCYTCDFLAFECIIRFNMRVLSFEI